MKRSSKGALIPSRNTGKRRNKSQGNQELSGVVWKQQVVSGHLQEYIIYLAVNPYKCGTLRQSLEARGANIGTG